MLQVMGFYFCEESDYKAKTLKELRKMGCKCPDPLYYLDEKDEKKQKAKQRSIERNQDDDNRTDQKKLHDFAETKILKLVISENNSNEVYAIVNHNDHIETFSLSSSRALHWLTNEHSNFGNSNNIYSPDFYKTILHNLKSKAIMNCTKTAIIYNRIAQIKNEIWYDLGNPKWQAIKISEGKVKTVKLDKDSPIFRRSQSLFQQITPRKGTNLSLDQLVNLLHIADKDKLVFKINLICLFLQSCSIPMIVFDGHAGSIKSTVTGAVKSIVDPSASRNLDNISAMAEKPNDLVIQFFNRYLASFDNVSYIDSKISDVMCRAITGSSNQRRKLYTDEDESIHSFRSKIVLNGVIPTLEYPDLQTRLITYERKTLDEHNRISDEEFDKQFKELLPSVLGQIFITLAKALEKFDKLKDTIKPKTRLADFEIYGEIISRCLGNPKNKFLNQYYDKVSERNISNQENYPIVETIQILMKGRKFYRDSVLNFHTEIAKILELDLKIPLTTKYLKFPKYHNQVTKNLKIVIPLLKTSGFDVKSYHWTLEDPTFTKNATIIEIKKIDHQKTLEKESEIESSLSSLPSLKKKEAQKDSKSSEDTSEDSENQNSTPSLKSKASSHKKQSSESSEDSEDKIRKYYCYTCDAGEFGENESTSLNGNIVEFHRKQGHDVRLWEKKEDV